MEAKDLRIGNLVFFPFTNETVEIVGINAHESIDLQLNKTIINTISFRKDLNLYCEPIDKIKPIPLNAEWFEKLGYYDVNMPSHFIKDEMTIDEHRFWNCNGIFIDDKNGVRVKYVHQLQNLYYALQQKELKIIINNSDFSKDNRILIININMSARLLNCLRNAGIDYLDELSECTLYQISRFRHIGIKSLSELQEIMSKNNIKFKQ
jgi:hypothetical protein